MTLTAPKSLLLTLAMMFGLVGLLTNCGCATSAERGMRKAELPPLPVVAVENQVAIPRVQISPSQPQPLIPVHYPSDATNYAWNIYGAPTPNGPWELLYYDLRGEPSGTLDVKKFNNGGFYLIKAIKL